LPVVTVDDEIDETGAEEAGDGDVEFDKSEATLCVPFLKRKGFGRDKG
jgi:hypothetical protein